jgi:hypothetical protein
MSKGMYHFAIKIDFDQRLHLRSPVKYGDTGEPGDMNHNADYLKLSLAQLKREHDADHPTPILQSVDIQESVECH